MFALLLVVLAPKSATKPSWLADDCEMWGLRVSFGFLPPFWREDLQGDCSSNHSAPPTPVSFWRHVLHFFVVQFPWRWHIFVLEANDSVGFTSVSYPELGFFVYMKYFYYFISYWAEESARALLKFQQQACGFSYMWDWGAGLSRLAIVWSQNMVFVHTKLPLPFRQWPLISYTFATRDRPAPQSLMYEKSHGCCHLFHW